MTIEAVPPEWSVRAGVKFDFRHLPDGHVVRPDEIDAELAYVGHRLRPSDIVLVNTAAGGRYGQDDYLDRGCGMQPLMPHGPVIALDIGILLGLARLNMADADLQLLSPCEQLSADIFGAVAHYERGQTSGCAGRGALA